MNKILLNIILLGITSFKVFAQNINLDERISNPNDTTVYTYAPQMPEYHGNLRDFINQNLNYPSQALKNKIEGNVIIEFVIEKTGDITNVKIVKGIDKECDLEALRLIKLTSGKWNSAKYNENPIRTKKVYPVLFRLNKNK